jgi:hypothetical protein
MIYHKKLTLNICLQIALNLHIQLLYNRSPIQLQILQIPDLLLIVPLIIMDLQVHMDTILKLLHNLVFDHSVQVLNFLEISPRQCLY